MVTRVSQLALCTNSFCWKQEETFASEFSFLKNVIPLTKNTEAVEPQIYCFSDIV